VVDIVGT